MDFPSQYYTRNREVVYLIEQKENIIHGVLSSKTNSKLLTYNKDLNCYEGAEWDCVQQIKPRDRYSIKEK